jgi:enoyl-CoA hydratase/carnithine racemase
MPECSIGLVPDVGGTHFLSAMPGETGTCVALTGRRVGGADAKALGLATHVVRSGDVEQVIDSLVEALGGCEVDEAGGALTAVDAVAGCLRGLERAAGAGAASAGAGAGAGVTALGAGDLASHRAVIERWFAADTVEDIVAALSSAAASTSASSSSSSSSEQQQQLASELLSSIRASSPTSLKVTLAALRRASPRRTTTGPGLETPPQRPLSLAECLRCELCMVAACLARDDFYEGVRAKLVDKGTGAPPPWRPGALAGVSAGDVRSFFAPETREVEAVVRRFEAAVGLEVGGGRRVTGGLSPRL